MDHDMHDDGLVHSHRWATEPPPCVGMLLRPANDPGKPAQVTRPEDEEPHDDGLVHGHGWAVGGGRGAG